MMAPETTDKQAEGKPWYHPLTIPEIEWVFRLMDAMGDKWGNEGMEMYLDEGVHQFPELEAAMPEGIFDKLSILGQRYGVGDFFRD